MNRQITWALASLVTLGALSMLLGFAHPFGDPRSVNEVATDAPSTLLLAHALMPVEVRSLLREKCADCHSSQTQWPWFGRFAPVSWLLEYDIAEAQTQLNLSKWESLPDEDILRLRTEIAGVTRAHMMPPWRYRIIHPSAEITDDDLVVLRSWARGDVNRIWGVPEKSSATELPGNATRGKLIFASSCGGCHTLNQNREGPKLAGAFGRTSGTAPGFLYSASLKKAAVKWDAKSLDEWLADPNELVPMNNMYFHVPRAQQRSDLIAYLQDHRQ